MPYTTPYKHIQPGTRFSRLVVISADKPKERIVVRNGVAHVEHMSTSLCQCDCGNKVVVLNNRLKFGNTMSCGCLQMETRAKVWRTHGGKGSRLYTIWRGMIGRCYYKSNPGYARYGGRGIEICNAWRSDFSAFREWAISHGYADDLTIDRIDNNGNYNPTNCRWATKEVQNGNRRMTKLISAFGKTLSISEWSRVTGISRRAITHRIKSGMPIKEVLSTNG